MVSHSYLSQKLFFRLRIPEWFRYSVLVLISRHPDTLLFVKSNHFRYECVLCLLGEHHPSVAGLIIVIVVCVQPEKFSDIPEHTEICSIDGVSVGVKDYIPLTTA